MNLSPPLGRRERKKIQTRQALLVHARALMAERGVGATRIEDITARTDVAKGVFYNYFKSKEDLVAELVQEGMEALFVNFLLPFPDGQDMAAKVRHAARAHRRFFAAHPEHLLLFHQARGLLKTRVGCSEKLSAVFRAYLERLAAGLFSGNDTGGKALALAAVVGGALSGSISYSIAADLAMEGEVVDEILSRGVEAICKK